MEKRKFSIPEERRAPLIVLAVGLLLIAAFLWLATQSGITYKGEFLKEQSENCWQGRVLGEETTVTWAETQTGAVLRVTCGSGEQTYELVGDRESLVLYTDGEETFRGGLSGGLLLDENGEFFSGMIIGVTTTQGTYAVGENGELIADTPLHLSDSEAVQLLLGENETTRGEPWFALAAGALLLLLFLDLWFPEWAYYRNIRRWTTGDPEPSDLYYVNRTIGHIAEGVIFFVILGMGLGIGG